MKYCFDCGTKLIDKPAKKDFEIIQDCPKCNVRHITDLGSYRSGPKDTIYTFQIPEEGE